MNLKPVQYDPAEKIQFDEWDWGEIQGVDTIAAVVAKHIATVLDEAAEENGIDVWLWDDQKLDAEDNPVGPVTAKIVVSLAFLTKTKEGCDDLHFELPLGSLLAENIEGDPLGAREMIPYFRKLLAMLEAISPE